MKNQAFIFWMIFLLAGCQSGEEPAAIVMTVSGPIDQSEMGKTLIHEHVFLDWTGADSMDATLWNEEEAFQVILPYLTEMKDQGVKSFLECTPAYLGRNPGLLQRLSEASGLQILTNTGYYGARANKYFPSSARQKSPEQLAAIWTGEFNNGIEGTGIRPGFIKIGVDGDSVLSDLHEKLIRAAAITHLNTGLTIVGHTGPEAPAFAQLEVLEELGVSPSAFVWTHAQQGTPESHIAFAKKGGWVSLDGMGWMAPDTTSSPNAMTAAKYISLIRNLKENGYLNRLLISHDAGWFTHGEENGGEYKTYTPIFDKIIPGLLEKGFTREEIDQLLVRNPAEAYQIRVRQLPG